MYESSEKSLLQFTRDDSLESNQLLINLSQSGTPIPKYILGNFLEQLAFSPSSGVHAQILINPVFTREHNLSPKQLEDLVNNGRLLIKLYLSGGDSTVLKPAWNYTLVQTGFSVGILDDSTASGLPLGWGALGYPTSVNASVGRVGGAIRLQGGNWPDNPAQYWPVLEDGPSGIRQGVFLPIKRCLAYHGSLWIRIANNDSQAQGELQVGFRRRIATPDGQKQAGECLASTRIAVSGDEWIELHFQLKLNDGKVAFGEPVDFYLRWLPRSRKDLHLLVDRVELYPDDAVEGFDPEVIQLSRNWPVPLLRWPGGNYVSHYHWRDGVGQVDLRTTCPNRAWGGVDYNLFGTDEFLHFCRVIGAEPQITVNSGTGTPEEAGAWVEYCNGDLTTPMGRLRAHNGHPEPFNVHLWEIGNEVYGSWQGGYHGSEENARRFGEFAKVMRAASPTPIEMIACGSQFDFEIPGPAYDHTNADRRWHDELLKLAPDQIDYVSLHSLPMNDAFLEATTDEEAHNAILCQLTTWERRYIPELISKCDHSKRTPDRPPIRLAITEWGPLGGHPNRLMVENFGAVVYTGAFLNMMIRNAGRVWIANATGFMHGGCIRKAFGVTYYDPQYLAIHQYAPFVGGIPLQVQLKGPGYDVSHHADLGATEQDVPYIDAIACKPVEGDGLLMAITNKHLKKSLNVEVLIPGYQMTESIDVTTLAYPDITARTNPVQPDLCPLSHFLAVLENSKFTLTLAPFSVCWIKL